MANGIPIVASDSHLFDDLDGIIPRPTDYLALAGEIDRIFSDNEYRANCVRKNLQFVNENNWSITAERHLAVYQRIIDANNFDTVTVLSYNRIGEQNDHHNRESQR